MESMKTVMKNRIETINNIIENHIYDTWAEREKIEFEKEIIQKFIDYDEGGYYGEQQI